MKLNKQHYRYQKGVDQETERIAKLSLKEIENLSGYGNLITFVNGKKISVGWNKWKFDEKLSHIVFTSERKIFLCFYKKYLNGIKIQNGKIFKLSESELANYD